MEILIYTLIGLSVISALLVLFLDVFASILAAGFTSLMVSIIFLILKAPDVAIAEASIGAALTVAMLLFAKSRADKYTKEGGN